MTAPGTDTVLMPLRSLGHRRPASPACLVMDDPEVNGRGSRFTILRLASNCAHSSQL